MVQSWTGCPVRADMVATAFRQPWMQGTAALDGVKGQKGLKNRSCNARFNMLPGRADHSVF